MSAKTNISSKAEKYILKYVAFFGAIILEKKIKNIFLKKTKLCSRVLTIVDSLRLLLSQCKGKLYDKTLMYIGRQMRPSLPTITFIVKLSGWFYRSHWQSDLCVTELCPDFVCVRFKGQRQRKWLSGLWKGKSHWQAASLQIMQLWA